jgi:hypothetical protein
MIDSAARSGAAAAEATPELWARQSWLAHDRKLYVTVTVVISQGIGAHVCDSNNHGDRLAL